MEIVSIDGHDPDFPAKHVGNAGFFESGNIQQSQAVIVQGEPGEGFASRMNARGGKSAGGIRNYIVIAADPETQGVGNGGRRSPAERTRIGSGVRNR